MAELTNISGSNLKEINNAQYMGLEKDVTLSEMLDNSKKVKRVTGFMPDTSNYQSNRTVESEDRYNNLNKPGELIVTEVTHKTKKKINPKIIGSFLVMLIGIIGLILSFVLPFTNVPSLILYMFKCLCCIVFMFGILFLSNSLKEIVKGTENPIIEEDKEVITKSPFIAKTPDQLTTKRLENNSKE